MVKIKKSLVEKLRPLGPRAHLPRLFMLGKNQENVITIAIELLPNGGCYNMPRADKESMAEAYNILSQKDLEFSGFGVITMKTHQNDSPPIWYDKINYSLSNYRKKNILWVRLHDTLDGLVERENGDLFIPIVREVE